MSFSPTAHGAVPETLHLAAGSWVLPPGYSAGRMQPGLRQMQLPPGASRGHQLLGELNSHLRFGTALAASLADMPLSLELEGAAQQETLLT